MSAGLTGASTTIVHPLFLLEEPHLAAKPLAFLDSQQSCTVQHSQPGFLLLECADGLRGYAPAALCTPLAKPLSIAAITRVVQVVQFYAAPKPGSQLITLLPAGEVLLCSAFEHGFARVRPMNSSTSSGYVPRELCQPQIEASQLPATIRLQRATPLLPVPALETQLVYPDEQLLLLGREGPFVLVQRESGQTGYLPALLCGLPSSSGSIFRVGPVDLGWIVVGMGWGLINWTPLALTLRSEQLLGPLLGSLINLLLIGGIVIAIWLFGARPIPSRSFAAGLLLITGVGSAFGGLLAFATMR